MPKTGSVGALFEVEIQKICTMLWRENDLEAKSLKTDNFGRFFEVEIRKFCTTLWRESDLEVKTVKNCEFRIIF